VGAQEDLVYLGNAIRAARKRSGLTQEALALESGLDRSYVGGVERGTRNVSYLNLLRIAAGPRVRLDEIIAEALRLEGDAASATTGLDAQEEA
jgi:transcriptional regulator with XRE-family HTH domain